MLFSFVVGAASVAFSSLYEGVSAAVLPEKRGFTGRATWYVINNGNQVACGGWKDPNEWVVAMNGHQFYERGYTWPSGQCNRQIKIKYGGKEAIASVVDECPTEYCNYGDLDLTQGLFQHFNDLGVGVFYPEWEWLDESAPSNPNPQPQPPSNCKWTYTSKAGDNCDSIGSLFSMSKSEVQAANSFVNCNDIWANTPICITTDTEPGKQQCGTTYYSQQGENCQKIESKFGLTSGTVSSLNGFVNCDDVWAGTPLCLPKTSTSCTNEYTVTEKTTCAAVASAKGLTAEAVKYLNDFVDCNDIWAYTKLCLAR